MNLVAFAFNIEDERTSLSLDIARQVVVIGELEFRSKLNFNRKIRLSWYHSRDRRYLK